MTHLNQTREEERKLATPRAEGEHRGLLSRLESYISKAIEYQFLALGTYYDFLGPFLASCASAPDSLYEVDVRAPKVLSEVLDLMI